MGTVYVKFGNVCEDVFVIGTFGGDAQAIAELPVGSGNKYVHELIILK